MGWLRKYLEESEICWDSPGRGSKFGICVCEDAHEARSSGCSLLSSHGVFICHPEWLEWVGCWNEPQTRGASLDVRQGPIVEFYQDPRWS
jgi:hypothetical protein